MNILGISAFYHDSAACLVKDGRICSAAQEERFTRKKHDPDFPKNAVSYCLDSAGLSIDDIDYVAFYEKPFLKFERLLETYLSYAPLGIKSFIKAMPVWIKQKVWIKTLIQNNLNYKGPVVFPEHHESHAASAFYPSPFSEAAVLTMDGVGEWTTTSFGVGKGNNLDLIADLNFPHSLGLLYSAFTYYAGFKVNSGEYKIMGLAPYGEPRYKDLILSELMDLKEDGSFRLNMKYFDYPVGLRMTNNNFNKLFGGPPRTPESDITQKEMDLARSIQEVTEEVVLRIGSHIRKTTGQKNLCLAGGVALNCVANGKLYKSGCFDNIWIQPAAGDAGGALGAALATWYKYLGNERTVETDDDFQSGSYLGPSFSDEEIGEYLKKNNIPFKRMEGAELTDTVADLIAQESVVGWFQGRMEFGPRALGGRSILGDARSPKMQKVMNLKIKFREGFRPFAPSVLSEKASEYFEIDSKSPYMLLVSPVNEQRRVNMTDEERSLFGIDKLNVKRSDIPAVTHVDYSSRLQTVHKDTNPLYYNLLHALDRKHRCPLVINTSFNVRGEPIVNTPDNAYKCFMRTGMDYLAMGPYLLDKKDQKMLDDDVDWKEEYVLD